MKTFIKNNESVINYINYALILFGLCSIVYMYFFVPIPTPVTPVYSTLVLNGIKNTVAKEIPPIKVAEKKVKEVDPKRVGYTFNFDKSKRVERFSYEHKIKAPIIYKGGKSINIKELESTVKSTLATLPHIKKGKAATKLVVETLIAESDGGRILDEGSGDYGIAQFRINSAKDTLGWLKEQHKDVYDILVKYYDDDISLTDNLRYNVRFSIALCVTEYWRKSGGDFYRYCDTIENRGRLWKTLYNTIYGAGTPKDYIERVVDFPYNAVASFKEQAQ